MQYNLKARVKTFQLLIISILSAFMLFATAATEAQTISVAPFRSIELHDGGHVTIRYGQKQTVTLLKGNTDCAQVSTDERGWLVIYKYSGKCPQKKYELEIEIVTPDIAEILVMDGGRIQTVGSFPRQAEIVAAVSNGGTIDIRAIVTDRVTASVEEGGGIFVMPQIALSASIVQGGRITYWGNARVKSSVQHGGAVTKGAADEADKPLSEFSPL